MVPLNIQNRVKVVLVAVMVALLLIADPVLAKKGGRKPGNSGGKATAVTRSGKSRPAVKASAPARRSSSRGSAVKSRGRAKQQRQKANVVKPTQSRSVKSSKARVNRRSAVSNRSKVSKGAQRRSSASQRVRSSVSSSKPRANKLVVRGPSRYTTVARSVKVVTRKSTAGFSKGRSVVKSSKPRSTKRSTTIGVSSSKSTNIGRRQVTVSKTKNSDTRIARASKVITAEPVRKIRTERKTRSSGGSQLRSSERTKVTRIQTDGKTRSTVSAGGRRRLRQVSLYTRPSSEKSMFTRPKFEKSQHIRRDSSRIDARRTRDGHRDGLRDGHRKRSGHLFRRRLRSRVTYREREYAVRHAHHYEHVYWNRWNRLSHRIVWPRYRFWVHYRWGNWSTFRYCQPYYLRRYVFVSLGGYWPIEYNYMRYHWYGYHPYQWYGYYPVAREVTGDSYNYYTYNYYGDSAGASGTAVAGPVDHTTFADVREKLAQQAAEEPATETAADTYFDEGVKAFEAGDYITAAEKFAKALELAPDDVVLPFALAQALFASEQYSEAAEVLRLVLAEISPEKEGVFYPRGLYTDEDVLLDQIERLAEKVEAYSYDGDLQLILGYQLLGLGELESAAGPLQLASQDLRNVPAAQTLLGLLEKMQAQDTEGKEQ